MAQLSSGRHIANPAMPLFGLIDAACTPDAVISRVLRIGNQGGDPMHALLQVADENASGDDA